MVTQTDKVIKVVKRYIKELERNGIQINEAFVFGSYFRGHSNEESDIDVALISSAFTGDRFADRRRIVPLRRKIDTRIEPMPFRPKDFDGGGILVEEIKRTGIAILKKKLE